MTQTRAGRSATIRTILAGLCLLAPALARAQGENVSAKTTDVMKEPFELLTRAKSAFARVTDYSCKLIKRERFGGELSPNHVVELKVSQKPFSVSMVWQEPKALEGQEVVYVEGKHDGKMRVKPGGLLGSVGFISLPPNDPRTRKTSKHKITEAGIGRLIEKCEEGWELERKLKVTTVRIATYLYAKRRCTRVELTHANRGGGKLKHYKNVVYFDQRTHLPIRVENYGWPEDEGQAAPLLESFSYVNLRLNPGVPADTFER